MAMCKGKKLWNTPPHVFAMSEKVRPRGSAVHQAASCSCYC
jgi:hypothetical protein